MEPTIKQRHKKAQEELEALNHESLLNRARSITVGTAFGGVTELAMRAPNGSSLYCIMQPVEVIELIHQLAANVGCHLQLTPRRDFASWRDWKHTEAELAYFRGPQFLPGEGHPPHAKNVNDPVSVGANLPPPEQQPGLNYEKESENGRETVAVEAPKQRRKSKRAAASS